MSGEILTTIIAVLTIFGFMSAQTVMLTRGQEQVCEEIKEFKQEVREEFKEVHEEFKEVRAQIAAVNERLSAEIAAVNERLSHTDGLVEGLSRALLNTNVA